MTNTQLTSLEWQHIVKLKDDEIERLDADAAGVQAELASVKLERHQLRNELTAARLDGDRLRALVIDASNTHNDSDTRRMFADQAFGRSGHWTDTKPVRWITDEGATVEPRAALTLDNGEIPTLRLWHKRSIETCMATGDREGVAWHRKRFAYFDKATDSTNQDGQQAPAPSGNAGLGTTGGASSLHQSSEKS